MSLERAGFLRKFTLPELPSFGRLVGNAVERVKNAFSFKQQSPAEPKSILDPMYASALQRVWQAESGGLTKEEWLAPNDIVKTPAPKTDFNKVYAEYGEELLAKATREVRTTNVTLNNWENVVSDLRQRGLLVGGHNPTDINQVRREFANFVSWTKEDNKEKAA